jgi:4-hydroxy-tetrahydrodipicolinate synthase
MKRIQGFFCPHIVPFTDEGRINEDELRKIVDWLIKKGVHGLYSNGSTGEFARLSFEERIRVIEIIADENKGRVPILAGAAENNIDLVIQAAKRYADLGCRAISVTGPYFFKVSPEGVEAYFREIARRSPIDILLYNIPQFSNEIPLPAICRLAKEFPKIIGTKDSSRDMSRILHAINSVRRVRPDFTVLVGCEEILYPSLMMGADGCAIATGGVVPEVIVKIFNAFQAGRYSECKAIQYKLLDLIQCMLSAGNFPEGFRAGAALRGFRPGRPRQPFSKSEEDFLHKIQNQMVEIIKENGLVDEEVQAEKNLYL